MKLSHTDLIRNALLAGRVLTGADCVDRKLGPRIMNYKGRMHDLRREGLNIPKDMQIKYHGHTFAIYYDADQLTFEEAVKQRFPDIPRDGKGRYLPHKNPVKKSVLDEIRDRYLKGESVPKIKLSYLGLSMSRIYELLHKSGIKLRKQGQQKLAL